MTTLTIDPTAYEDFVTTKDANGFEGLWRLVSLLEMLQIYALRYVQIGQMYQEYVHGVQAQLHDPKILLTEQAYDGLMAALTGLHKQCADTHLVVAARTMERIVEEFRRAIPSLGLARERMSAWFSCFTSELETKAFMLVEPSRVPYLPTEPTGSSLLLQLSEFPDARYDAHQAGCCLGYGCFTASVYHLMRLAEHGLVSVASALNVDQEKIAKGWDGCIAGIQSAINTISSTKPTTDWQSQVKKYSDLSSWFTTIKTGWRNPVSHIPRIYTESAAIGMFSATRTLFEHLNKYGFKQTSMPADPLLFP